MPHSLNIKIVFSKTGLFIDDVVMIVLVFLVIKLFALLALNANQELVIKILGKDVHKLVMEVIIMWS